MAVVGLHVFTFSRTCWAGAILRPPTCHKNVRPAYAAVVSMGSSEGPVTFRCRSSSHVSADCAWPVVHVQAAVEHVDGLYPAPLRLVAKHVLNNRCVFPGSWAAYRRCRPSSAELEHISSLSLCPASCSESCPGKPCKADLSVNLSRRHLESWSFREEGELLSSSR